MGNALDSLKTGKAFGSRQKNTDQRSIAGCRIPQVVVIPGG